MIKNFLREAKRAPLKSLFGKWRLDSELGPGYTIVLPSPMDMPFMLRLGLEGIKHIDTTNCSQILVVPDGWGDDRGAGLRQVAAEFDDPRIRVVDLRWIDYLAIRSLRPPGCAHTHWMMVVNGVLHARSEYAFLHDADAFFLDPDGLERQYSEAATAGMYSYGVEERWDEFFTSRGYCIPGTWELMFSTRWARERSPLDLMPGIRPTRDGEFGFDSMLYGQYLDHDSGRVGVMPKPPRIVHFNGTIFSYRLFRDAGGKPVTDELFRVLLLSLIESSLQVAESVRACPDIEDIIRGLRQNNGSLRYASEVNRKGYGEFREMVERLCHSPVFAGERAERIREHISAFDDHFEYQPGQQHKAALEFGQTREASIGEASS